MAKQITKAAKPFKNESQMIETPEGEIDMTTLPGHAVHYLTQYGINKSLQDSVAGLAKKLTLEGVDEAEIDDRLQQIRADRWQDILSGDIGKRGIMAPRARGIERVAKDIAIEALRVAFAKSSRKWPDKVSEQTPFVAAYLLKYGESTRAEAQRRIDLQANDETNLDELLG